MSAEQAAGGVGQDQIWGLIADDARQVGEPAFWRSGELRVIVIQ